MAMENGPFEPMYFLLKHGWYFIAMIVYWRIIIWVFLNLNELYDISPYISPPCSLKMDHMDTNTFPIVIKRKTCDKPIMLVNDLIYVKISRVYYCRWFRNPVNSPVEVGPFTPIFTRFLFPRWLFGISEPSTVGHCHCERRTPQFL